MQISGIELWFFRAWQVLFFGYLLIEAALLFAGIIYRTAKKAFKPEEEKDEPDATA
jgi:hypothetical protein